MACLITLREKVIKPLLSGATTRRRGRKPTHVNPIDTCYQNLRVHMEALFDVLGIAA